MTSGAALLVGPDEWLCWLGRGQAVNAIEDVALDQPFMHARLLAAMQPAMHAMLATHASSQHELTCSHACTPHLCFDPCRTSASLPASNACMHASLHAAASMHARLTRRYYASMHIYERVFSRDKRGGGSINHQRRRSLALDP